ncbi:L,D-transpeptidase [Pelagibacterium flavum]|uniref:L,D-transpeptidase n=1 Tax=Pelagibacterium flavum TaxID=2984530 RepID=A0ABY6IM03_9HYPH|nr:L,D-transpeptidase [Pelagibacterium sp. YIM 151497]MAN78742.1 L,D-transpeptidase [Hyphomicrobiales bacterium]UYQ71603.1 L,D-transpeptidase [Pelagibacterium sp. YIM 151497]|tara:strand:+ start:4963 stop:5631 length:669 start_codon:yes stop_codon:yes gene_type:complete
MSEPTLTRRGFMAGASSLLALTAAGCTTTTQPRTQIQLPPPISPEVVTMYAARPEEQFPVPAVDLRYLDPKYYRQRVPYPTTEKVGTVIVDTPNFYLYHVEEGGTAMRYGAGLGRAGFEWSGRGHIAYSREWPVWTPPSEMVDRQPELEKWRNGQPPGLDNPLGARALYIHEGNRDTIYRIHGTGETWTIGQAVSSGCVRLLHQDVIHLADNVRFGSPIVVL